MELVGLSLLVDHENKHEGTYMHGHDVFVMDLLQIVTMAVALAIVSLARVLVVK